MRILCAIGIRRGRELVRQVSRITRAGDELVLLHVIDTGPRHDLDRLRGPLHPRHERHGELDAAEEEAGKAEDKGYQITQDDRESGEGCPRNHRPTLGRQAAGMAG